MHLCNDSGIYRFSLSRKAYGGRKTGSKEVENKREWLLFVIQQLQESLIENKETDVIGALPIITRFLQNMPEYFQTLLRK